MRFRGELPTTVALLAFAAPAWAEDRAVAAEAVAPEPNGTLSYTPEFFARFAPRTASDMLAQVPGFVARGTDSARGLGQATSNVLINGERVSGKSEDALSRLSRIPAANVIRIELVDAASLSLPGLSGQVANVVVRRGGLSGHYYWRGEARPHYSDPLYTRFEVALSGSSGPLEYTLGINNLDASQGAAGGPTRILDAGGAEIERRHGVLKFTWDKPTATATFKLDGPGTSVGNLSLTYNRTYGGFGLDERRGSAGVQDRLRSFRHRERGFYYEISGDWEFALGPGRLKLIGLERFDRNPLSQTNRIAYEDGSGQAGDRYAQRADTRETVARGEYGWKMLGADWQLSGEAAFNALDKQATLETLDSAGQFVEVPFPGGNGGVREVRYEAMLSLSGALAKGVTFQLAGGAEFSTLAQTGPNGLSRSFRRPKGSAQLAWTPEKGLDLSFTLSRKVGQLDFGDFLARVYLGDGLNNAANSRLVPQQSWHAEVEAKKALGKWGSATLRLYDERIEDIVDFVPVAGGGESRGNLPKARRRGLDWSSTLELAPMGFRGARLNTRIQLERSRLRDPLTGQIRPIGETQYRLVETDIRHDVPGTEWAWGINFGQYLNKPYYRPSEVGRDWEGPSWLGVMVEHKNVLGMTVMARVGNIANARNRLDRKVYAGPRATSPLLFEEHRNRLIGPIFSLTLKGNF